MFINVATNVRFYFKAIGVGIQGACNRFYSSTKELIITTGQKGYTTAYIVAWESKLTINQYLHTVRKGELQHQIPDVYLSVKYYEILLFS